MSVRTNCLFVIAALLCITVAVSGCSGDSAKSEPAKEPNALESRRNDIVISTIHLNSSGITFGRAEMREVESTVSGPATFVPIPDNVANVSIPISGIIDKVLVNEGAVVREGQPLCYIRSTELEGLRAEYFKSKSSLDLAEQTFRRQQRLHEQRLISDQDMQEAQAHLDAATAEFRGIEGMTRAVGLERQDLSPSASPGSMFVVRAPIAGTVTVRTAIRGSQIDSASMLFKIVQLRELWADVQIPADHAMRISPGDRATLSVSSDASTPVDGIVDQIGSEVNPSTRCLSVKVRVRNEDRKLLPQLFARATIMHGGTTTCLCVPNDAIAEDRSGDVRREYVFLKVNDSTFSKRIVTVGSRGSRYSEIRDGLADGETVATNALFILKSVAESKSLHEDED